MREWCIQSSQDLQVERCRGAVRRGVARRVTNNRMTRELYDDESQVNMYDDDGSARSAVALVRTWTCCEVHPHHQHQHHHHWDFARTNHGTVQAYPQTYDRW